MAAALVVVGVTSIGATTTLVSLQDSSVSGVALPTPSRAGVSVASIRLTLSITAGRFTVLVSLIMAHYRKS